MSVKRYSIVVNGRVQGVGYRYFTRDAAQSLGLSGWVRNTADGCVELEVEGGQDDIDCLIEALKEGPALSRVTSVDVQGMITMNSGGEFFIKR
jgi:acylphosphatase